MRTKEPNPAQPQVEIRPMDIDDLSSVLHLGDRLFTLSTYPTLFRTWDEYEVIGFYQSDPDTCLVAVHKKKIVGFLLGTVVEKHDSALKYGYLVWLGVAPEFKSSGVGTRLFDEFKRLATAEGVHSLLVDTQADNEAAIAFFVRRGFGNMKPHVYLSMRLSDSDEEARPRKPRSPRTPRAGGKKSPK